LLLAATHLLPYLEGLLEKTQQLLLPMHCLSLLFYLLLLRFALLLSHVAPLRFY
jgi:hypothetical protein